MRRQFLLTSVLLAAGVALAWSTAQATRPAADDKPARADEKPARADEKPARAEEADPDEQAIRKAAEAYAAAFTRGDLEGLMSHWARKAEYIDDAGKKYAGRPALAQLFRTAMADFKGLTLKVRQTSVRLLKDDLAIDDGFLEMTPPKGEGTKTAYTAVWTKADGKWLLASVRDLPDGLRPGGGIDGKLKGLGWLVGEWTHSDAHAAIELNVRKALDEQFLHMEVVVKPKEGEGFTVLQMVGWDPAAQQIRSWFFDSRGGFGEGTWTREGNAWTVSSSGLVADGRSAGATYVWKHTDDESFLWQSKERDLDGEPLPDQEVKFTRKASK